MEVAFKPSLEECFPTLETAVAPVQTTKLATVIISSYSKDENVLNGSNGSVRMEVSSVPKGFCQYLHDRKKAGVISYGNRTLYILPPKTREDTVLICICAGPTGGIGLSSSSSSSQSRCTLSSSSSSSTGTQPTAPASKSTGQAPVVKKGDDFLSSLLDKVSSLHSISVKWQLLSRITSLTYINIQIHFVI